MLKWCVFTAALLAAPLISYGLDYRPPVDYEPLLAGNFGESRPNHFHGGLDIKTDNREGKKILAVADGYVSRVSITPGGFGNAVFIAHPDGHTSVYAHLRSFSPRISALVTRWRQRNQQSEGMMYFNAEDCPVAQGEIIAISGNTGSSTGPHLHLEMHDTRTWDMLDPLEFIGGHFTDGMAPSAHSFMAYPKEGDGSFMQLQTKSLHKLPSTKGERDFKAWGKVGFGIWADDYMEGSSNYFGIRHTELKVDGKTVFKSDINGIPFNHNMMINSWGDYEYFKKFKHWFMKSFVEPGNRLPILTTDANRGWINFNEERNYELEYILIDYFGNSVTYPFTVQGVPEELPGRPAVNSLYMAKQNVVNYVQLPGMQLVIPYGLLADDTELQPLMSSHNGSLSRHYSFQGPQLPLFGYASISIEAPDTVKDPSKLYLVADDGQNAHFIGNEYKDGWVSGETRDLDGIYYIKEDHTAPTVLFSSPDYWAAHKKIVAQPTDEGSGLKEFKAFIDGRYVIFTRIKKSDKFECALNKAPVLKNGSIHRLKFIATDNCGNVSVQERDFKY